MTDPTLPPDSSTPSNRTIQQTAQNIGRNAMQVSGNYNNQQTVSLNLMISVFFISILALGGIAWALNLGPNPQGSAEQTDRSPAAPLVEE